VKILCVASSYPRHAADGAGRFVYDLSRGLRRLGATIETLSLDDGAAPSAREHAGSDDEHLLRADRVGYTMSAATSRLFYGSGAPENLERAPWLALQAPAAIAALAIEVSRRSPHVDVVLAHWLVPSALAAVLGAATSRTPVVAIAHSGDVHALSRFPFGARLARFIARRAARVVSVAGDVRARLAALGVPSIVSPLGVELPAPSESRQKLRARLGMTDGERLFVSLGRLEPIKGHDVLLRAAAAIARARVLIGGEGSLARELARLAHELRVPLTLPGSLDAQAKADLLCAADVAVFPSRSLPNGRTEGMPVAMLEALSAHRPVVASRTGALAEAAGSGAILVAPDDPRALRRAIEAALERPVVWARAAARAAAPYLLDAAAARWMHLLRPLAARERIAA
jgi:glycosyltransferase involved in cell wall biosynthesis